MLAQTLGLQSCFQVMGYSQGGLSFKRVLDRPDRYLSDIGRRHPDLLVIDLGTNDLACGDTTVADVADNAEIYSFPGQ